MEIKEVFLTPNKYSRPGTKINKWSKIAIHYVGNAGSTAVANRNYFESLKNGQGTYASSHFIIGLDGEVLQLIPLNEISYCTNSANSYAISIECCHPKSDGKFNEKTRKSLIELCVYLCKLYNLNEQDIIRHYDITKKACPLYWVNNEKDYILFKQQVKDGLNEKEDKELKDAVNKIIKSGIVLDINSWCSLDAIKLTNVKYLLNDSKLGSIETLSKKGIITDKKLWVNGEYNKNHVKSLLIKYANTLK